MPTAFSNLLRLALQATGENSDTWGVIANTNTFEIIEDAVAGIATINVTTGNTTLTTANGTTDQARMAVLKFTGSPVANLTVTIPSTVSKTYFVINAISTAYTITFTTGSGTTVTIPQNKNLMIGCDGTNVYAAGAIENYLVASNNLSDLTNTATARTNLDVFSKAETTAAVTSGLQGAYPVGSVYMNASASTNPAVLLGFGTWTAFGAGRVLVGVGQGTDANGFQQTFANAATGGEYRHTQVEAELAAHQHTTFANQTDAADSGELSIAVRLSNTSGSRNGLTSIVGSSTPMQWMQPYIAVYMWVRTA